MLAVDVGAVVHAAHELLHHHPLHVGLGHMQQLRHCHANTALAYNYLVNIVFFKKRENSCVRTGLVPGGEEVVVLGALLEQLRSVVQQPGHPVVERTARRGDDGQHTPHTHTTRA